jgi:uncharacterized protein YceK
MNRKMSVLCMAAVILAMSGCASVQIAPRESLNNQKLTAGPEQNIAHINAQNWGIYFFAVPLLTGDPENRGSIAVMKDTVNVKTVANLATKKSREFGATKSLDMVSSKSTIWIAPLLVIFYRSVEVSTNAVQ